MESLIAKYGGRQLLAAARDKYESVQTDQAAAKTTTKKAVQDEASTGVAPVKVTGHLQGVRARTGARRQMCAGAHTLPGCLLAQLRPFLSEKLPLLLFRSLTEAWSSVAAMDPK